MNMSPVLPPIAKAVPQGVLYTVEVTFGETSFTHIEENDQTQHDSMSHDTRRVRNR